MTPPKLVALALCVAGISVLSYYCGLNEGRARTIGKPEPLSGQTRWIGRLTAGDGGKGIYQVSEIELGMRADGLLTWRLKSPDVAPPIPLKSVDITK